MTSDSVIIIQSIGIGILASVIVGSIIGILTRK